MRNTPRLLPEFSPSAPCSLAPNRRTDGGSPILVERPREEDNQLAAPFFLDNEREKKSPSLRGVGSAIDNTLHSPCKRAGIPWSFIRAARPANKKTSVHERHINNTLTSG